MQIVKLHQQPKTEAEDPVLQEYLDARAAHQAAEDRLRLAKEYLLAQMKERQQKSIVLSDEGVRRSITFVQRETPVIDEKGLRRALKARVFDKYTEKKLNKKALEAAMESGEIDPMVVADFVEFKQGNPYIDYRETKEDQ